jgi:hypothetical protein
LLQQGFISISKEIEEFEGKQVFLNTYCHPFIQGRLLSGATSEGFTLKGEQKLKEKRCTLPPPLAACSVPTIMVLFSFWVNSTFFGTNTK